MAAPAKHPIKTAAAPMPRAQRYKVERRAGAVVAASSFSLALLELWAPLAAAYTNATLVGALVIALAVLVPMMPGMSMAGMMGGPDIPPGWAYEHFFAWLLQVSASIMEIFLR